MKPDFLCIGAQKAATTWLYMQMRKHPQIWAPPIKELNFFNDRSNNLYKRLFSKHWIDKNWRKLFKQKMFSSLPHEKRDRKKYFGWYLKYFFSPRSLRWYMSLFPPDPGKISGEFSVFYSVLREKGMAHIAKKFPHVKIIYILRSPVFRTWSQVKMNLLKIQGHNLEQLSEERLHKYFNNPLIKSHSDYIDRINVLEKHFSPGQIFIGFFEEIEKEPAVFLEKVFAFLGVDFPEEIYAEGLDMKANVGIALDIPGKYSTYLSKMYYPQIKQLHRIFNNRYTKEWLDAAEKILRQDKETK